MNVSIIVLTKNEEKHIRDCLESLLAQTYEDNFEVLVVDHGSEDKTCTYVTALGDKNIRLLHNSAPSIGSSRNMGVKEAQYPYIAFIDGDCSAPSHWLQTLTETWKHYASSPHVGMVGGGNMLSIPKNSWFHSHLSLLLSSYLGSRGSLTGNMLQKAGEVPHIPTVNCFTTKALLQKFPFQEHIIHCGEDQILSWTLQHAGYRLYYTPQCSVSHSGPESLRDWILTMKTYGEGRMWMYFLYPTRRAFPAYLPLLPVLVLGISIISAFAGYPKYSILLGVLFVSYAIGIVCYSAFQKMQKKKEEISLWILAGLYISTHLAYGVGLFIGLITYFLYGKHTGQYSTHVSTHPSKEKDAKDLGEDPSDIQ